MAEIDSPETAKRIYRASRMWIFERTVGIYAQARGGNPRLEGSGVLLQIADAAFMLSAAHVLKASEDAAIMPAPMMPSSRMIPMPGARITFTAEQKQVDVGFVRLPDEVASELKQHGKKFTTRADIHMSDEPSCAFYNVVGYPAKTNTPDYQAMRVDVLPLSHATYLYDRDDVDSTPGVSIVLRFRQDTITRPDGESDRMPSTGRREWRKAGVGHRTTFHRLRGKKEPFFKFPWELVAISKLLSHLRLNNRNTLQALKVYLLLAAFSNNTSGVARMGYDTMDLYGSGPQRYPRGSPPVDRSKSHFAKRNGRREQRVHRAWDQ